MADNSHFFYTFVPSRSMDNYLEIIGAIVGLVYLWLEYKASIYLWIASIIMPAIYLVVFYDAALYADTAINIYYLLIALYGWINWRCSDNKQPPLPITHTPLRQWVAMALLLIAVQGVIWAVLHYLTNSPVPFFNSLTSALSIVGMWMLARKYIEQWIVWFVTDILSAALYLYMGLYFTAALYALYAVIAIFGYLKWKRLMTEQ